MDPEKAHALARLIVEDLCENGNGDKGDRLVITADGPPSRDLGGWSRLALLHRIARVLAENG